VKRRQKIDIEEGRLIGMVWRLFLLLPLIGVLSVPARAAEPGHTDHDPAFGRPGVSALE